MATCTKVPADYEVTLRLSRKEAEVLLQIGGLVGGAASGPRGFVDAIYKALIVAGVHNPNYAVDQRANQIHFIDAQS